jgi:hypothetical protein
MSDKIRPRPVPCSTCPYRRDVPSGVWAASEYDKLPIYDLPTGGQAQAGAFGVFMCHQRNGAICSGWAGCHDMDENLAIRMDPHVDGEAVRAYVCPVPLFSSGAEAAAHGKAEIASPGPGARRKAERLRRRLALKQRQSRRPVCPKCGTSGCLEDKALDF